MPLISLELAIEKTGFQVCEFEPDGSPCECCKKPNLQHYWRRTDYWENEGEYFCADCVINLAERMKADEDLTRQAFG